MTINTDATLPKTTLDQHIDNIDRMLCHGNPFQTADAINQALYDFEYDAIVKGIKEHLKVSRSHVDFWLAMVM